MIAPIIFSVVLHGKFIKLTFPFFIKACRVDGRLMAAPTMCHRRYLWFSERRDGPTELRTDGSTDTGQTDGHWTDRQTLDRQTDGQTLL